jgi:alpha-galactosidase
MQRRQFLQLSGFSAAALIFDQLHAGAGVPYRHLHFPSKIAAWRGGQWLPLTGSKEHWALDQLEVAFRYRSTHHPAGTDHRQPAATAMGIQIKAPGMTLEKIRLSWDLDLPSPAKYLGDAWERSYGDLSWTTDPSLVKAPWYILIQGEAESYAFGVKTGAGSFCHWQVNGKQLELFLDTSSGGGGVQLGERVLDAAEVVFTTGAPGETTFQTDQRFCRMMCEKPRLPQKPVYGINDWYFAYGKNSKQLILDSTRMMMELAPATDNKPFSVVDDGWMMNADFMKPNEQFGDMSAVAADIKNIGMRPGLWTRPLLASKKMAENRLIPLRNGEAGGKERYLDPTLPENLQQIRDTIRLYKEWGFHLVKHDYSTYDSLGRWGSQMKDGMTASGWHFNDRSKTNAEILLQLYTTIRQAAGEMYLIGCNTVSHLSAGIFELNRIGDDTSGREWDRTLKMGVNTMGFRLPQHNAFYAVDGDCVGLTTAIPWEDNKQWMQLLAESGAPLFISAQKEALGPEQRSFIKLCFGQAARVQPTGEPLDWMSNPRPAKWRLNGRVVEFKWG